MYVLAHGISGLVGSPRGRFISRIIDRDKATFCKQLEVEDMSEIFFVVGLIRVNEDLEDKLSATGERQICSKKYTISNDTPSLASAVNDKMASPIRTSILSDTAAS